MVDEFFKSLYIVLAMKDQSKIETFRPAYMSYICPEIGPMSDRRIQDAIRALDFEESFNCIENTYILAGPMIRIPALPPLPTFKKVHSK